MTFFKCKVSPQWRGICCGVALWWVPAFALAQDTDTVDASDPEQTSFETISSGWGTRCNSTSRTAGISCELEIRIGLETDGRQLTRMAVQQGPDLSQPPRVLFELPHGLYNPAGLRIAVNEAEVTTLPIETCDNVGCYAAASFDGELASQISAGERLTVTFQDLSRRDIGVPIFLEGFEAGLAAIR